MLDYPDLNFLSIQNWVFLFIEPQPSPNKNFPRSRKGHEGRSVLSPALMRRETLGARAEWRSSPSVTPLLVGPGCCPASVTASRPLEKQRAETGD